MAHFSEVLKKNFSSCVAADWFLTGRRPGLIGTAFRTIVPLIDAMRLTIRLLIQDHDVYHLNPSFAFRSLLRDGVFLVVLRLFRRRQTLVFFRGWDPTFVRRVSASPLGSRLFLWVYGYPARVLVLGSAFSNDLKCLGMDSNKVFVSTTMFEGAQFLDVMRRRNDKQVRILFLARLIAAKGIYQLLKAFRRIADEDPHVSLVMAGSGEEASRVLAWCVENGLQERVELPGYVGGAEKAQILLNSDIFVLPSFHGEGCPNALLEAMGAGLPVIVTPVGGIPDLVQHGLNGLIVEPEDVTSLEKAIRSLVNDPFLCAAMGTRNHEQAWQRYEAHAVTEYLENHYRAVSQAATSNKTL